MNDIYIDVGSHKTATTFRQLILYPEMNVTYHTMHNNRGYLDLYLFSNFENGGKHIISNENLSGWTYYPDRDAVADRRNAINNLSRLFPDAHIIICKREQIEWQKSLYKQYIWAGGSDTYEGWLSRLDDKVFDIDGYIGRLQDVFDDILVLDFDLLKRDHRAFSRRICDFVGVPLPEYENRRLNVSLSDGQTRLLRHLNKLWWTHERKGIPGFRMWRELLYMLSSKGRTVVR